MPYEIAPTSSFATDEHVQEHLEGLLEDGHDQDEMKEFIETHGNSDFMCYYCLLYTSPSPRDPKTSRMPSSA